MPEMKIITNVYGHNREKEGGRDERWVLDSTDLAVLLSSSVMKPREGIMRLQKC